MVQHWLTDAGITQPERTNNELCVCFPLLAKKTPIPHEKGQKQHSDGTAVKQFHCISL